MLKEMRSKINPNTIMMIILFLYLGITVITLSDYSDAWDNVSMFQYGRSSAAIFGNPFKHYFEYEYGPVDLRYFGPFIVTAAFFIDKLVGPVLPFWSSLDIFRLCYFITYLIGVWFFFKLGTRYFSSTIAIFTTLLFIFQPLFFGQAPTSPKDTTFLGLTIIGIYLGLRMSDEIPKVEHAILPKQKVKGISILIGLILLFLMLYQRIISSVLRVAAGASENNLVGQLFGRFASQYPDVPIEQYIAKLSTITLRTGIIVFFLAALATLGWKAISRLMDGFRGRFVVAAGILLGIGISVRILGLLVGGVVLFVLIFSRPIRDWFYTILAYTITGSATIYLTWPYLWPKPLTRFLESLQVNLGHQHNPSVLFKGTNYLSTDLPREYVLTLIGVQFTLPLIILATAGFILMLVRFKKTNKQLLILTAVWFVLPIVVFMITRPAMHDNIRHSLFITAPLFLLAGYTLEFLMQKLKGRNLIFAIVILIALTPGIYHIIKFHPYEYIYFNSLAGGTNSGVTQYEADYLALSLSEGIEYINQHAETSATVYAMGPENIARSLIREDLNLISRNNFPDAPLDTPNTYLVTYEPTTESYQLTALSLVKIDEVILGGVYTHPDSE